ncbi:hypothetical protein FA13DRAFT_1803242 [Coprinellus micaceus]|uniref:DUF6699 domain-containing protein n=1 Tax=Coprinellus micaceus TaxID=71717 RepID=A0A4Y7SBQ0_COPMI|nr:hypothetical protein FA13DRAFT_1803242 [Coprinellus micaceus]
MSTKLWGIWKASNNAGDFLKPYHSHVSRTALAEDDKHAQRAQNYKASMDSILSRLDDFGLLPVEWMVHETASLQGTAGYRSFTPNLPGHSGQQALHLSTIPISSPPPLPRRRFIDLPPGPELVVSVHPILAYGDNIDANRMWDVRTPNSNFHLNVWRVENHVGSPYTAAIGSWRTQDATTPALNSLSIHVEGAALGVDGWAFEVTPRYGTAVSVQDVLDAVHAQCSCRGREAPRIRPEGALWRWGGLLQSNTAIVVWTLLLF